MTLAAIYFRWICHPFQKQLQRLSSVVIGPGGVVSEGGGIRGRGEE